MPTADAIRWFKNEFQDRIEKAVKGTPFTVDFLAAIACQETGPTWNALRRKNLTTGQVLALCVGDTLDEDRGRRAFPRRKADLLGKPRGQEMFDVARRALVDMAAHIPGYAGAAAKPDKFCRGFGIFQYDLQFFEKDPAYFLEGGYADFDASLGKALGELKAKQARIGLGSRTSLDDLELAAVAIAYNTGGYKPSKGLKQGYFNGKQYYGEAVFDYLRLARSVSTGGAASPAPGLASLAPPTPVMATGATYEVDIVDTMLNVRSAPVISDPPKKNVTAQLPDGQRVRAVDGVDRNGFLLVETSINGALIRGHVSRKYLKPVAAPAPAPAAAPASAAIPAVWMPVKQGLVTKRTAPATAHSLNEAGQPGRRGETAAERRAELAAIIDWLAVDSLLHRRYRPLAGGITFCNIYAHDYCHLAGVYLPRVWWSSAALVSLAQGHAVAPQLGKTVDEIRANALFRWLRDFGEQHGWRRTGTLTKLQTEVNQGAIGVIVARRTEEGRSGHIVAVVPETDAHHARRNAAGEVVAPLQSQAGTKNFRYDTGKPEWWKATNFAEFAFWLHP